MQIKWRQADVSKQIILGIALWCAAELAAFLLVVSFFGVSGALLLGLVTSLLGFSLLKRLGRGAAANLRHVLNTQGLVLQPGSLVDGSLAAIGAALLILPGFISDLVGLGLSAPSIRFWLVSRLKDLKSVRPRQEPPRDHVIDLGAQEWRRIDEAEPDLRGHP
jgi:UPF0716 protein FxsA